MALRCNQSDILLLLFVSAQSPHALSFPILRCALQVFTADSFFSDHFDIVMDISTLHKVATGSGLYAPHSRFTLSHPQNIRAPSWPQRHSPCQCAVPAPLLTPPHPSPPPPFSLYPGPQNLAYFEPRAHRAALIHKRRATRLLPLSPSINPAVYPGQLAQVGRAGDARGRGRGIKDSASS